MTFATQVPSGAWWKQLTDHLYRRAGQQIRGLQIRKSAGRLYIVGRVPSEAVRQQVKTALLEVVPEDYFNMEMKIDGEIASPVATPAAPSPPKPARSLLTSMHLYRRLRKLAAN